MVSSDCVDDARIHAVFFGKFGTNLGVFAFDFVSYGFTNIVEEGSSFGDFYICANFFGDKSSEICHFGAVFQDVLAVACAEF